MLELVLLDGSEKRFTIEEGTELLVGVAAHCAVRLGALDVSRTHALITCQHGRALLLDLGSTNGTFVNGKRIREAELGAGDAVRFSSVLAQLVPPSRGSEDAEAGARGNGVPTGNGAALGAGLAVPPGIATRVVPAPGDAKSPTSDRAQGLVEENLDWLFARWGNEGEAALAALVEWLVVQVGMRGAAVLECVGDEVVVAAAHGEVKAVLDDPGCVSVVRNGAGMGTNLEGLDLSLGHRRVVALKAPDVPWLLLVPGQATPDSSKLAMVMRLLAVARRIDLSAPMEKP
ncbi:MAG: FHA domain-containing protein [Thermoanaerobaculales bacterium]